jgi:hypothetical protein
VRGILRAQAGALDPYDQQGLTGDLYEHLPDVDGHTYMDSPRADTLALTPPVPTCIARRYLGYIRPDDAVAAPVSDSDLVVSVLEAATRCVEGGFLQDLREQFLATPGAADDEIGGVQVARSDTDLVIVLGDTIIDLSSQDPGTFERMAPFIEAFLAGQPG